MERLGFPATNSVTSQRIPRNPRRHRKGKTSGQISRLLKRLRLHSLIKKIGKNYKHYLTSFGTLPKTGPEPLIEHALIPI
jgi:hypothetical protein